jgi:hypothetical protein
MEKYFGIFAKDFDTQEVQEAKSRGVTSKKISQNEKKTSKEGTQAQKSGGFWIIQMLHERWIDPDHP